MPRYNRVFEMVDKGEYFEVKVAVMIPTYPYVALEVFEIKKKVCEEKKFTPRVGTKFRTGGWAECPWHLFGGRNLRERFIRWEKFPGVI